MRGKIEIYTVMIDKIKIIENSQGVLEIYMLMIVTKITIKIRGEIKVELFIVVLMKKHLMKAVMVREDEINTLMVKIVTTNMIGLMRVVNKRRN